MTDPKRWLDDASFASSLEHELLVSGKRLGPPEGAAARSWSELAPLLGPGPGSPGSSDPSGSSGTGLDGASGTLSLGSGASSLGAGTIKAFVVGAALGVGVMGVVQAARTPTRTTPSVVLTAPAPKQFEQPAPRAAPALERQASELHEPNRDETPSSGSAPAEPSAALALRSTPVVKATVGRVETQPARQASPAAPAPEASVESPPASPLAQSTPAADASATPEVDRPSAGPAASGGGPKSANWLRAEAQDMARAKNLLGSGRASEALVLLQNAADRFGGGALMQEREALIVEALFSSGRSEQGRARARAFVQKYPNSPMSERMRKLEHGGR